VDRVDEVVEEERDHWQPPPANVNWGQARFFQGVCRARGRVITLLDAGQILKLRNDDEQINRHQDR
jgi:chemotaxis signal transduction protein